MITQALYKIVSPLQNNDSGKETYDCGHYSTDLVSLMFLGLIGCDGTTAELNELTGVFGKTDSEYKNNMTCRWRITVATGKVRQRPKILSPQSYIIPNYCSASVIIF